MWKGRTFQLFFIWLITVELILNWDIIQTKKINIFSIKSLGYFAILTLPIVYVIIIKLSWIKRNNCRSVNKSVFNGGIQWHYQ